MQKFISNSRKTTICGVDGQKEFFYLPLNSALINLINTPVAQMLRSISILYIDPSTPLCTNIRKVDFRTEVIAIKDISKGDEITKCYIGCNDIIEFGFERKLRMKRIRETLGFDCNCFICLEKRRSHREAGHWPSDGHQDEHIVCSGCFGSPGQERGGPGESHELP